MEDQMQNMPSISPTLGGQDGFKTPQGGNRPLVIILLLVIVVLLIAGGIFWVGYSSRKASDLGSGNSEELLKEEEPGDEDPIVVISYMERKRSELESFHYDIALDHILERKDIRENSTIKLIMNGDIDIGRGLINSAGKLDVQQFAGYAKVMAGENEPLLLAEFETIAKDGKMYYKIINANPELDDFIKNKWVEISAETSFESTKVPVLVLATQGFVPVIEESIRQDHFFQKASKLPSEDLDGQRADRYRVSSVMDSMADITFDGYSLVAMARGVFLGLNKNLSQQQIADDSTIKYAALLWDSLLDIPHEIWIGEIDHNLYKIKTEIINDKINTKLFEENFGNYPAQDSVQNDAKLKISFTAEFSDFDKPVDIKAPKDFVNQGNNQLQPALSHNNELLSETEIKGKLAQMRSLALIYHDQNNSYLNFCKDEKLEELLIPVDFTIGALCYDRADTYCIQSALQSGNQICFDPDTNWLEAKEVSCNQSTTMTCREKK